MAVTSSEAARARYSASEFTDADYITLTPTRFLIPGFVDTHLHPPQWPSLATGMEGNLREWCENYTDPIEASYHDTAKAHRVYGDVVQTTLRLGSTTVAYNSTIHFEATNVLADMCLRYGQRAVIGKVCMLVGSRRGYFIRVFSHGADHTACLISWRAWAICRRKYKDDSGHALGVQAHMCETTSDQDRRLDLHKQLHSYAEIHQGYGMLYSRSILAHCIHLSETDLQWLEETQAEVGTQPEQQYVLYRTVSVRCGNCWIGASK